MKKLFSLVLASIMALGISTISFAADFSVEQKLQQMGVPNRLLATMPEEIKEDMAKCYDEGGTYGGTDTQIVEMGHTDKRMTRSAISSRKLELEVTYITMPDGRGGTAHRKVYGDFRWLTNPGSFECDAVALEWGNGWVLSDRKDPSFVYQYYGAESGKIFSESTRLNTNNSISEPNAGLCYTKLKLRTTVKNGNETAVDHNGWLMLELERDGGARSTNVIVKYIQTGVRFIPVGSISFKSGSISVTPTIIHKVGQSKSNFTMR
ncbi:hypothetical protein [Anaerotignum sp. MB30-C6]|uniref:hypothetical protein n=1 Tax=Anaerotignum sp. MB30-C6 TaxID=3070814 RepID=UPI0027DB4B98|nr:hypothetical protein [Anaerotignum sp. MB30-C6]WMI81620.1 hypothetical protein RBQ60_02455 [Anaerotignum sp. MB30-C6]